MYESRNRESYLSDTQSNGSVDGLLADVEAAIRDGERQYAYQLSIQATQVEPENIDAWLLRASLAPTLGDRVLCMNRLSELRPDHEDRHHVGFFALRDLLHHDPFLVYQEETKNLYRVRNADHMVLSIPKRRAFINPYPHERSKQLRAAYHWLALALFGLMLAGIGTIIFAPLAALTAIDAGQSIRSRADQVSAAVVLILAIVLFLIGFFFSILFILHLIG